MRLKVTISLLLSVAKGVCITYSFSATSPLSAVLGSAKNSSLSDSNCVYWLTKLDEFTESV